MAAEAHERDQRSVPGTVTVNLAGPGYALVAVRGEHDLSTQRQIREALQRAAARTNVVVDLSECEFLDSMTVGMLVATDRALRERGGRLEIALPPPLSVVHRIFEVLGLDAMLLLHDTPEHAQSEVSEEDASTHEPMAQAFGSAGLRLATSERGGRAPSAEGAQAVTRLHRDADAPPPQQHSLPPPVEPGSSGERANEETDTWEPLGSPQTAVEYALGRAVARLGSGGGGKKRRSATRRSGGLCAAGV